jgi:hypothetical protein
VSNFTDAATQPVAHKQQNDLSDHASKRSQFINTSGHGQAPQFSEMTQSFGNASRLPTKFLQRTYAIEFLSFVDYLPNSELA